LVSSNRALKVAQKREIKALQAFVAIDQQAAALLTTHSGYSSKNQRANSRGLTP